ncbi:MAG TPA: four helix bundle protein [Pyrinomonadaceae bacterium]|nr:four helix bundle protein [Pyrinomonadaceae bacterium]
MQRNTIRTFEDLLVWQKAIEFVKEVYMITNQGDLRRDFGLRDQMRRAAVSIPTNIAEGFERSSRKEYLLFLNIAKGSAGETRSLLRVALEVGYFTEAQHDRLRQNAITLSKYLFNQMNSIRNAPPQQLK